jgi:hypothetical protein
MDAPDSPGVAQVFLLERYAARNVRKGSKDGHKYKAKLVKTAA